MYTLIRSPSTASCHVRENTMPHVEIKYTNDIELNDNALFDSIETTINTLDSSAGVCKSRAYPAVRYKHTHVMVDIWLLPKAHRNEAFNQRLLDALENAIKNQLPQDCYISLEIHYRDKCYKTIE